MTSLARAIFDFASIASPAALERAAGAALAKRLVSRAQLFDQLERRAGHRGAGRLRAVLAIDGGPAFTRSNPERRLLGLVRRAGLPLPRTNFFDGTFELDLFWPREHLIVEMDSFAYHSDPLAFERDRLRDAELEAQGYRVMRITDTQLRDDPEGVLNRLKRALRTEPPA